MLSLVSGPIFIITDSTEHIQMYQKKSTTCATWAAFHAIIPKDSTTGNGVSSTDTGSEMLFPGKRLKKSAFDENMQCHF